MNIKNIYKREIRLKVSSHKKNCPNCFNKGIKILHTYFSNDIYEKKLNIIYNKNSYFKRKWYSCRRCNFFFSNYHFFSEDYIAPIYEKLYREDKISRYKKLMKLPLAISTNKQRVKYIKENIKFFFNKKIIKFKNKKHLDIGGGSGLFAIQFKDRNWNSSVLDVCKKSLIEKKYNIKHYNLNILKNRNKVRKKYNLVTIIDCLEHIKNFRKFLYEIKKNYLARDGIIFIDCPSKTNFGKININDDIFNSCHLNMWDFQSFSILAQSLNFEIISYKISSEEKNYFSFKCFLINKKKIFLKHRKSVLLASKLSNKYKNLYYTHK